MYIKKSKVNTLICSIAFVSIIIMLIFDKVRMDGLANLFFLVFCLLGLLLFVSEVGLKNKNHVGIFIAFGSMLLFILVSMSSGFENSIVISGFKLSAFILISAWISLTYYKNLNYIIFVASIFLALFLIYILNQSGWVLSVRMMTIFYNPNSLGMILSSGIFFALFGVISLNKGIVYFPMLIFFTVVCLYSNSRTAILAPYLSFIFWLFFSFLITRKKIKIDKKILFKILCFFIVIFSLLNNEFFVNTVSDTIVEKFESKDEVSSGRVKYIIDSIDEVNFFSNSEKSYHLIVDNTFVAYAYDFGLFFSIIMIGLIVISIFLLFMRAKSLEETQLCMAFVSIINFILYANLESIRFSPQSLMFFLALFFLILTPKSKAVI